MCVGFGGDSGVKSWITRSYQKEKWNSPIHAFSTLVAYVVCVVIMFFILIRPCFHPCYTSIAVKSYMPPTFSYRMLFVSLIFVRNRECPPPAYIECH